MKILLILNDYGIVYFRNLHILDKDKHNIHTTDENMYKGHMLHIDNQEYSMHLSHDGMTTTGWE